MTHDVLNVGAVRKQVGILVVSCKLCLVNFLQAAFLQAVCVQLDFLQAFLHYAFATFVCCPVAGLNLLQQHHQQQQQQQLSSSYSPARPLLPSGRTPLSAQQQLLRQQQQQQQLGGGSGDFSSQVTAMAASPAPLPAPRRGSLTGSMGPPPPAAASSGMRQSSLTGGSQQATAAAAAAAAAAAVSGDFLGSGSLAHSFNHNLLMSPVSPAHINNMAAVLAAARRQQQQQQGMGIATSVSGEAFLFTG
jgi:hypothetical protein